MVGRSRLPAEGCRSAFSPINPSVGDLFNLNETLPVSVQLLPFNQAQH